jgi:hypothetical protein
LKAGILPFAFGVPETILSNRRIAQITSQKARELEAPVYTQLDISIEAGIEVEFTEEQPGNPPPTLRFARGAVEWARRKNLTDLWIVAAKPHLWRCVRDLIRAIREVKAQIEIHVCEEIEQYPEDEWFCADSTQERTQSKKNWEGRERIIKLMPFFVYKFIAS